MFRLPIPNRRASYSGPVLSSDGRAIAVSVRGGVVVFRDLDRPANLLPTIADEWIVAVGFTPDGREVIVNGVGGLRLLDAGTGTVRRVANALDTAALTTTVTADGTAVAVVARAEGKCVISRFRWAGDEYRPLPPVGPLRRVPRDLSLSADGQWFVAAVDGIGLQVWATAGDEPPRRAVARCPIDDRYTGALYAASSADGGVAVAVVITRSSPHGYRIEGWSVSDRALLFRRRCSSRGAVRPAFHPTRPVFLFADNNLKSQFVSERDARTGRVLRQFDWGVPPGPVAYSPDGAMAAMASAGELVVWDAD